MPAREDLKGRTGYAIVMAGILLLAVGVILLFSYRGRTQEVRCVAVVQSGQALYEVNENRDVVQVDLFHCAGVPVITGQFRLDDGPSAGIKTTLDDRRLDKLLSSLIVMRTKYPELYARISEIRHNPGGLSVYLSRPRIRIELEGTLDEPSVRRIYGALSYLEKEKAASGVIDLRGAEALFLPREKP